MNDRDERIILPDRGVGRDLGRNPAFTGGMPGTRQDSRDGVSLGSVGGWGERNDSVRSMAATAIGVSVFTQGGKTTSYRIAEGAGALRGWSISADFSCTIRLRTNNANGTVIAIFGSDSEIHLVHYLGDFGVSYDSLWIEVVSNSSGSVSGAVWVASVE